MTFATPPSTTVKTNQTALRSSAPATSAVLRKKNIAPQTAQNLAKQLTSKASTQIVAQLSAAPSAASIAPVSQLDKPHRLNNNDVQTFKKGSLIYRADDFYNNSRRDSYEANFFALNIKTAKNNYGEVELQFEFLQDVNLLRLDKNVDGFKTWLDNSDQPEEDKKILHKNFGYPTPELPNAERQRNSIGNKDRGMLNMIKKYAEETDEEIHGYYTDLMIKCDGASSTANASKFHAEVALFDQNVFSKPTRLDNLTDAEVKELNALAKVNAKSREFIQKRKRNALEMSQSSHEQGRANTSEQANNFKARRLTF